MKWNVRSGEVVLYCSASSLAILGLVSLVRPSSFLSAFGILLFSADASSEIRAVYGGFFLGVGVLLAMLGRRGLILEGLAGGALSAGGLVVGRLVGLLLDRGHGQFTYFAVAIDSSAMLLSAAFYVLELKRLAARRRSYLVTTP